MWNLKLFPPAQQNVRSQFLIQGLLVNMPCRRLTGRHDPRRLKSQLQMTSNLVFHIQEQPFSSYHIYIYAIPAHNLSMCPPLTSARREAILQPNLPVQPIRLIKHLTAPFSLPQLYTAPFIVGLFSEL